MGELVQFIPRGQRHSVNSRHHALWDVNKTMYGKATQRALIEAEYEDALAHLADTQSDAIDREERAFAVTRYTLAAIRMHEEGDIPA